MGVGEWGWEMEMGELDRKMKMGDGDGGMCMEKGIGGHKSVNPLITKLTFSLTR